MSRELTIELTKKRFMDILYKNDYSTASELAEKIKKSRATVYRYIRLLREEGVGIMFIPGKGYIPSNCASKRDDVGFMRGILGRRASDWVAMNSAQKEIKERWISETDQKLFKKLLLEIKPRNADKLNNMYALLSPNNELNPANVMKE